MGPRLREDDTDGGGGNDMDGDNDLIEAGRKVFAGD